ncbi:hypothetical protein [Pseudoalteromonas sp. MMG007]|uniref:hypothetical protein n=1 Tax=Pseudoalteromonas sp. MMG007 TaxID=2822684 RepID=UPI001B3606EB|nr:hypothetical protein [Pseudoalteromonas sp. MMG007]MBQ4858915.1 hypothetical protein [Pseudoalteromonas sp. MMG007]
MIIGNQTATYSQYQSAQQPKAPQKGGNELPDVTGKSTEPRTVDMHNIGMDELNALIKETGDGRLLVLPYDSFKFENGSFVGVESKDFIAQIKNSRDFAKSIGDTKSEKQWSDFLDVLHEYDGYQLSPKINVEA